MKQPTANKIHVVLSRICRTVVAVILIQTLFFKFTGAPESVYIFKTLGVEPWGRLFAGGAEMFAVFCLFIPGLVWLGAILVMGMMGVAGAAHLTVLGISVMGDGGLLFALCLLAGAAAVAVAFVHRREVPIIGGWM